ncbi:MAG: hypothetical protein R3E99_00080 [Burkholderiaceae bacterium]
MDVTQQAIPPLPAIDGDQQSESLRLDRMWGERSGTLYKAWVQVRYHRKRQRFYDLLDKITKAATVVLGATMMGKYLNTGFPWLATALTCLGFLALVFGYGDRKQHHKELAEHATRLVADIEAVPVADLSFQKTTAWASAYAQLVAKSPPPLKSLTLICEREQSVADGHSDHVPVLPWWKRWPADFI